MNWRPILATLAWLALAVAIVEAGTIWACSRWIWTPIQRHYLAAYIWCSLPAITPATAEVRLVWKTGPHRKRQLATDDDAEGSEYGTGMALSQSASDAGWKRLMEGPPQEVPTAKLGPALADFAYDDESLWSFLLLPEACGLVAVGYGLYGFVRFTNRFADWAVEHSFKCHRSWWEEPSWSLLDWCAGTARKLCSCIVALHKRAQHCMDTRRTATSPTIAPSEPAATPPSFAIPIFGVYNGTGEGYLWNQKDEIA